MGGVTVNIKIGGRAGEMLARLSQKLGPEGQKTLSKAAASGVAETVRAHLFRLGTTRHDTAQRLGAKPTNIIGRTAEGVAVREEAGGAAVVVPHPLFKRAFNNVRIAPVAAKALAIPVNAVSYDKAPRSFPGLFVWTRKENRKAGDKGAAFLARAVKVGKKGSRLELLYLLRRGAVEQKQDRKLLPSDADMSRAGKQSLKTLIRRIVERRAS